MSTAKDYLKRSAKNKTNRVNNCNQIPINPNQQISSYTSLQQQIQCLAMKVSHLSMNGGRTLHPSKVMEQSSGVKLRPKKLNTNNLSQRMSCITISETTHDAQKSQEGRQRPLSLGSTMDSNFDKDTNKNLESLSCNQLIDTLNNDKMRTTSDSNIQLLHPDWRRIPWKDYFGWTEAHRDLCHSLRLEARRGQLQSIYYNSPEEHLAAGMTWRYHNRGGQFLGGPSVNTVAEALEVIYRVHNYSNKYLRGNNRLKALDNSVVEYDADDEDLSS